MEEVFWSINIEYRFTSCVGNRYVNDCITEYKGVLYADNYDKDIKNEYAGELDFKIINLRQAEIEEFDIYELFDTYEYTFRHGQSFYDLFKNSFKKPVLNKFPDLEFECSKLCIIETIGIIPKFRGKGIGAKAFKDLVWRFDDCELFILQPYPLQFELPGINRALSPNLALEKFEQDKRKATASLSKYYQSWGFQKIRGINDLLFYCSLYRNETFDNISMDDF